MAVTQGQSGSGGGSFTSTQLPAALVGGRLDVNIGASALPTGASTEATLALIKAKTDNIDVALSTRTKPADQQHVIVDSSALPTGAATQTTLASVLAALPAALVGGRLDVNIGADPATVSVVNSSVATLGNGGVFTGTSEDISGYASIAVSVFTDQASAAGGLSLQFSSDGTNWDHTRAVSVSASSGMVLFLGPAAKFFRVVYTNGATPQTVFRLQTVYRKQEITRGLSAFQDVNATLSPTAIVQRVGADLLIADASGNVTNRARSAKDLAVGVGGGSVLSMALGLYDGTLFQAAKQTPVATTAIAATGIGITALGGVTGTQVSPVPNAAGLGDGGASQAALATAGYIHNGSNLDRMRTAGSAANTTGTGLLGTGLLYFDGTNYQNVKSPGAADISAVGAMACALMAKTGSNNIWLANSNTTADADNGSRVLPTNNALTNGVTWDRQRSNTETAIQASTSTAAGTVNTDIVNYNGGCIFVRAHVASYGASGTLLMKLQEKDVAGNFVDIPGATTGAVATGADIRLIVGPNTWPANTASNFYVSWRLPRTLRVVTTVGVNNVTFAQDYAISNV